MLTAAGLLAGRWGDGRVACARPVPPQLVHGIRYAFRSWPTAHVSRSRWAWRSEDSGGHEDPYFGLVSGAGTQSERTTPLATASGPRRAECDAPPPWRPTKHSVSDSVARRTPPVERSTSRGLSAGRPRHDSTCTLRSIRPRSTGISRVCWRPASCAESRNAWNAGPY